MSFHTAEGQARARAVQLRRHSGYGATKAVRKALESSGQLSAEQLAEMTGFTLTQVKNVLANVTCRFGVVRAVPGSSKPRLYEMNGTSGKTQERTPKSAGSGVVAGRITIGRGARWWAGAGFP